MNTGGGAVRRGPGALPYAGGIHSDFGWTAAHFAENLRAFASEAAAGAFEAKLETAGDDIKGFEVLNFWRPVTPMRGPVVHKPLALLDPRTVVGRNGVYTGGAIRQSADLK